MTHRFRPQTAQLQLCFCCSFIFLNTVSFSTLTKFRLSSSDKFNQNSLIRSLSSVVDVDQIFELPGPGPLEDGLEEGFNEGFLLVAPFPLLFPPPAGFAATPAVAVAVFVARPFPALFPVPVPTPVWALAAG